MENKAKKWTSENIEELISLSKEYSPIEISSIINRTKKAVENKLFRLGISQYERFREKTNCLFCNKEIYDLKINKRKFCDNTCSAKYINNNRDNESYTKQRKTLLETIEKNKVSLTCNFCGEKYFGMVNGKFCSDNCRSKYHHSKKRIEIICKSCKCCFIGNKSEKFCSNECKDVSFSYKDYKALSLFNFRISDYPDEFEFKLIEKHGWYSPTNKKNNLGGVSRDHMISVKEGFDQNIDTRLISHPANCKLMIHNENSSKNYKSSITLEELIERVKAFDIKYRDCSFYEPYLNIL